MSIFSAGHSPAADENSHTDSGALPSPHRVHHEHPAKAYRQAGQLAFCFALTVRVICHGPNLLHMSDLLRYPFLCQMWQVSIFWPENLFLFIYLFIIPLWKR